MISDLCVGPDFAGDLLSWLDAAYCSSSCRFKVEHPDIVSGERSHAGWLAEQNLSCKRMDIRYACTEATCGPGEPNLGEAAVYLATAAGFQLNEWQKDYLLKLLDPRTRPRERNLAAVDWDRVGATSSRDYSSDLVIVDEAAELEELIGQYEADHPNQDPKPR